MSHIGLQSYGQVRDIATVALSFILWLFFSLSFSLSISRVTFYFTYAG